MCATNASMKPALVRVVVPNVAVNGSLQLYPNMALQTGWPNPNPAMTAPLEPSATIADTPSLYAPPPLAAHATAPADVTPITKTSSAPADVSDVAPKLTVPLNVPATIAPPEPSVNARRPMSWPEPPTCSAQSMAPALVTCMTKAFLFVTSAFVSVVEPHVIDLTKCPETIAPPEPSGAAPHPYALAPVTAFALVATAQLIAPALLTRITNACGPMVDWSALEPHVSVLPLAALNVPTTIAPLLPSETMPLGYAQTVLPAVQPTAQEIEPELLTPITKVLYEPPAVRTDEPNVVVP